MNYLVNWLCSSNTNSIIWIDVSKNNMILSFSVWILFFSSAYEQIVESWAKRWLAQRRIEIALKILDFCRKFELLGRFSEIDLAVLKRLTPAAIVKLGILS